MYRKLSVHVCRTSLWRYSVWKSVFNTHRFTCTRTAWFLTPQKKCEPSPHLPNATDTACGQGPGHDLWALLHESTDRKPQAVPQCVLILQEVLAFPPTREGVVPLIWTQPDGGRETNKQWNRESLLLPQEERWTVNIMIFKIDLCVLSDSVVPGSQEEYTANGQIG